MHQQPMTPQPMTNIQQAQQQALQAVADGPAFQTSRQHILQQTREALYRDHNFSPQQLQQPQPLQQQPQQQTQQHTQQPQHYMPQQYVDEQENFEDYIDVDHHVVDQQEMTQQDAIDLLEQARESAINTGSFNQLDSAIKILQGEVDEVFSEIGPAEKELAEKKKRHEDFVELVTGARSCYEQWKPFMEEAKADRKRKERLWSDRLKSVVFSPHKRARREEDDDNNQGGNPQDTAEQQ
ncbi:hypothetical protein AKO1_010293, partial [Acrasis kona]